MEYPSSCADDHHPDGFCGIPDFLSLESRALISPVLMAFRLRSPSPHRLQEGVGLVSILPLRKLRLSVSRRTQGAPFREQAPRLPSSGTAHSTEKHILCVRLDGKAHSAPPTSRKGTFRTCEITEKCVLYDLGVAGSTSWRGVGGGVRLLVTLRQAIVDMVTSLVFPDVPASWRDEGMCGNAWHGVAR